MPLLICPNCSVGMTQVHRSGIELDICPQCRGVWLDRGELEKLLQPLREAELAAPTSFLSPGTTSSPWLQPAPQPVTVRQEGRHGHDEKHGHHEKHWDSSHSGANNYKHNKGWRGILDVFD